MDLDILDVLLIQKNWYVMLQGCKVGILFDVGLDNVVIQKLFDDIWQVGGMFFIIVFKVGGLKLQDGMLMVDGQFVGLLLWLFDVVVLVLIMDVVQKLV